jgi:lysophospholipase L1-like esterase
VLCVGDSVTFGYNASDDSHAYPALLEDLLKVKGFGGKVINAGMPRYRLEHVCNMLEHMHPGLRPKAMIILGGWNDIQDKILKPERTAFSNFLDWVRQDVYLYKTPNRIINGPHSDGLALRLSARIDCGGVDEYVKSANRLILIAKAQGAMPVICTLPHFYENIKDEAAELKFGKFHTYGTRPQIIEAVNLVNARIGKLAESGNVLLIDLSAVDSPDRFDDAVHPNDSGNAAIAKIICEKLAPLIAD